MKEKRLQGLINHETGVHIKRRITGEKSKLKILGLGLDRFLKEEEGLVTHSEQQILGMSDFAGFNNHFAASLAFGLDGKKKILDNCLEF